MDPRPIVLRIPLFARKFVIDAVETGAAALVVLSLPIVQRLPDWQPIDRDALGHAAVIALAGAVVSAARRALPAALAWTAGKWAAVKAWILDGGE